MSTSKVLAMEGLLTSVSRYTNKWGVKTMDIYKVKQGKLEENLTRSTKAMAMFHSIERYAYSIRVWLTIEEALAAVGQQ